MRKILVFLIMTVVVVNIFSQDDDTTQKNKNGWDYYSEGKYRESLKALETEKKYYPERINIYVISAWCYRELKDYTSMEKVSLEGLKIQPTDSRVYKNLAEATFYQGKYSDSIQGFENYLKYKYQPKSDSYFPTVYYYLGICYFNLSQFRKADICLSTANYYFPRNLFTVLYLAEVKEKLGEYKKAYDFYNFSLTLKANNTKGLEGINRLKDKIN